MFRVQNIKTGTEMEDKNKMAYNAKLKQAIKQKGLTQNDVSEKISKNPAFLSMVINGKWIPTDAEKALIANALQVQISEIFEQSK